MSAGKNTQNIIAEMKSIVSIFAICTFVFLTGCAQVAGGLLYKDTVGEKLDFAYAKESITPGVTTMAEIRAKIGDPYRDIQNQDSSTHGNIGGSCRKGFLTHLSLKQKERRSTTLPTRHT